MEVYMENIVGKNLKLLRESNGYTQERVAGFLKLNRSAYANYEAGERAVPLAVAETAAELYGVDLAVLFEPDSDKVRSQLICAFRAEGLDEEDMKQVAAFKAVALNYLKMNRLLES